MNNGAFYKLSYGLYVVTSGGEGKFNGQIANTVFQVTSEPPAVAVSINKQNYTHEHILASRRFAVSILEETTPMTMIGRFGFKCGRDIDKLEGIGTRIGKTGVPIVTEHAVAFIEAEVVGQMDCGTHTIFLGQVVECDVLDTGAEPMTTQLPPDQGRQGPQDRPHLSGRGIAQASIPRRQSSALHLHGLRLPLRPREGRSGWEGPARDPLRGASRGLDLPGLRGGKGQVRQGGVTPGPGER
jgi:ferric-chelate reductase [NAD(P)H]